MSGKFLKSPSIKNNMIGWILKQNKYSLLFAASILLIVVIGVISPIISDSLEVNKEEIFDEKIAVIQQETQNLILEKEQKLFEKFHSLALFVSALKFDSETDYSKILEFVTGKEFSEYSISLFNSDGRLVAWNNNNFIEYSQFNELLKNFDKNEAFFYNSPLSSSIAVLGEINAHSVYLSLPLEKNYKLRNDFFKPLSLSDEISKKLNLDLKIIYQKDASLEVQPQSKLQFDIVNSSGIGIGHAYVAKININEKIDQFENLIFIFQAIFILSAFTFLGLWLYSIIDLRKLNFIKVIFVSLYILLFRIILHLLDITHRVGMTELNNPMYFSSTFGFGIVKSPIELFFTVMSGLLILVIAYKYTISKKNELVKQSKGNLVLVLGVVSISLLFFAALRMFGATIKSVVFDSSILYFKDNLLFSDISTTFMYSNILLIGASFVLLALLLTILLIRILKKASHSSNFQMIFAAMIFLQLFGFIFDLIQPNPQTSWFIRIVFVLVAPFLAYYSEFTKTGKYSILLSVIFLGSFFSISLLSYFNFELEKRALKTISTEMSRSNINLLDYYADEIIYNVAKDVSIKQKLLSNQVNFNSEAFVIWSNSSLSRDSKKSIINIISADKNLLGNFNYEFSEPFVWDWDNSGDKNEGMQKVYQNVEGTENQIIRMITPINFEQKTIGYVEVSILYDVYGIGFGDSEELLSSSNLMSKISFNINLLKIFKFRNNKLINYYTDALLSEPETETILNAAFTKSNDRWMSLKINNEDHTFYLSRHKFNKDEEILAIGLRDKDASWNLYDFFKVFFVHSMMILIFLILLIVTNLPKLLNAKISFKMKILTALLIVSVLPMLLLAGYFKNITEEKNSDAVYYKLGKRADNVSDYLNNYFINSTLTEKAIFDKAVEDLEVHFSIYEDEKLLYSSEGIYYKIGLLPDLLNPLVFDNFFYKGEREFVLEEAVENYSYNSFYSKAEIGGQTFVLSVNDAFNRIQLPMTGTELNIFLFGTYSLAILLILLLSTLLANQISAPIEQLTKATKSVGSGDLDIQIQNSGKGEIKELADGFNKMVKELKKNQLELAEVERESAWKEMAKQVAHEIKNPLTPMKLAVQHLISAYNDKSEKFDGIFSKVTTTLITQIDNLTNIASEFSSFAKMPSIKLLELELIKMLKETIDLFMEENCKINLETEPNEVHVKSDTEQLQRMMINLIRNSIQAEASSIIISVMLIDNEAVISVKDNGHGIKDDIREKIFDENVTTKKEGMGLGLTLARRFLDLTGGSISLYNSSSTGTEVIVKIPLK